MYLFIVLDILFQIMGKYISKIKISKIHNIRNSGPLLSKKCPQLNVKMNFMQLSFLSQCIFFGQHYDCVIFISWRKLMNCKKNGWKRNDTLSRTLCHAFGMQNIKLAFTVKLHFLYQKNKKQRPQCNDSREKLICYINNITY